MARLRTPAQWDLSEHDAARSMTDAEIIAWASDSTDVIVRELANRYDMAVEKLEAAASTGDGT